VAGTLRITGGRLARRRIAVPPAADRGAVRPTSDRVREALFSSLAARGVLDGARALDLFAGSGALGIEALSRGARDVVFVERAHPVARVLRDNLRSLDVERDARVVERDVASALADQPAGALDLVLADPPYAAELDEGFFAGVARALAPAGLLVLERDKRTPTPTPDGLSLTDDRVYGSTRVMLFERSPEP
jgi:16S rRNA (guanine966-N2)-methyltransferase